MFSSLLASCASPPWRCFCCPAVGFPHSLGRLWSRPIADERRTAVKFSRWIFGDKNILDGSQTSILLSSSLVLSAAQRVKCCWPPVLVAEATQCDMNRQPFIHSPRKPLGYHSCDMKDEDVVADERQFVVGVVWLEHYEVLHS